MAAPTAAKVAPPNINPLNVTPVAIIASNGTTSVLSVCFIRLFCFSFHTAKVCNYFICTNNLDYFFHLIFCGGGGANIPIYISAAPDYFCPNCKHTFLFL